MSIALADQTDRTYAARPDEAARPDSAATPTTPRRSSLARVVLGRPEDPRWARLALWALLLATAVLYLWNLTISGYANEFYAAAVQSGTKSLKAWLFGSLDSANSITVDKPPAALWVMVLSARIFGFSSFSLLLPQALMGVGTVALTHASVKRVAGHAAGLVAGALVALTPVAALMFRFDNPDALLTLLMTFAAYCLVRAIETPRGRNAVGWLAAVGFALGTAFLTKMLQGLLVVPAFGLAYVLAAQRPLWTRLGHSLVALTGLVVGAGWFIALVELWPTASRPYIGGSTNNSLWELALGYNGLGRIFGGGTGGGGGMGGNTGFGGTAGLLRMFNSAFAGEISWLIPAALLLLVAGLAATWQRPRTDVVRASLVLWGGWLLVTLATFSLMTGTIHPYYAVALAPAIAACVAIGGRELWLRRTNLAWRGLLALAVAATSVWGFCVLATLAPSWLPWLRWTQLVLGLAGAGGFLLLGLVTERDARRWRVATATALTVGVLGSLLGTGAWTMATVSSGHNGSIPTSGPAAAGSGTGGGFGGTRGGGDPTSTDSSALVTLLQEAGTPWSAAVVGDQSAASLILSSNTAVMAIGGWSGSDDSPTLAQFKAYVAEGKIHYFLAGGGMGGRGGGPGEDGTSSASAITAWVEANFTAKTVGGQTVYDLTATK